MSACCADAGELEQRRGKARSVGGSEAKAVEVGEARRSRSARLERSALAKREPAGAEEKSKQNSECKPER